MEELSRICWHQPEWPPLRWQAERLASLVRDCDQVQGPLLGMVSALDTEFNTYSKQDALLQNIATSSAIEGEQLNASSMRTARSFGLEQTFDSRVNSRSGSLEGSQKAILNITDWLEWFLTYLMCIPQQAPDHIDQLLVKVCFWQKYCTRVLSAMQIKTLNYLLDSGECAFEEGIIAAHYQEVANISKASATRNLCSLLNKGYLYHLPAGGVATRDKMGHHIGGAKLNITGTKLNPKY